MHKPGKRKGSRFEVEWITIPYRTLLSWGALPLVALALAGGAWLLVRYEAAGERRAAERLVAAVERELGEARRSRPAAPEIAEAGRELDAARARLAAGELAPARAGAEQARRLLRGEAEERAEQARLLQIEGQVQVKRVGALEWKDGRLGMALGAGDLIKTGHGSAAQYVNLDGSVATLSGDTVLRIERSAKDRLSGKTDVAVVVNTGQLTVQTTELQPPGSTAEVQTPNLRASVDPNTRVGVGVEPDRSRLDVVEGRARVEAGSERIEVGASERVSVSPGGVERRRLPGIPQLLSPPQYKLLLARDLEERPLELQWAGVREAGAYRVELGQSPLFTKLVERWERHPTNAIRAGAPGVGRYYWRVAAVDRDGVEGAPSPAAVFQISDVLPEGEPPPLQVRAVQPLGEGMFLLEGRTAPGVFLTFDDGRTVVTVQPVQSGEFRQVIALQREGRQVITITARNSEGLERKVGQTVEVQFQ